MRRIAACVVACLLATCMVPGGSAAAEVESGPAAVARIMIVGDSVSQGKSGDFTWRYRLWRTLRARGKEVDFVGPRTTLADGGTAYADPNFDQDHAARWGALMTADGWWVSGYPEDVTADLVATYSPDVVIDDLGVNNLLYGASPDQVIALAAAFVADVRAVRPHATVVFGQLTQRWFDGVDAYNAQLVGLTATLDQPDARVLVATAPADYTSAADTYDGSHPNSQGEIEIADQFWQALASLPLPHTPSPPTLPAYAGVAHLDAVARRRAVRLSFSTPSGASLQTIWKRDLTRHGAWRRVASVGPSVAHFRVGSLRRHHRYAFKLLAFIGTTPSSSYSNVARARAG